MPKERLKAHSPHAFIGNSNGYCIRSLDGHECTLSRGNSIHTDWDKWHEKDNEVERHERAIQEILVRMISRVIKEVENPSEIKKIEKVNSDYNYKSTLERNIIMRKALIAIQDVIYDNDNFNDSDSQCICRIAALASEGLEIANKEQP